MRMHRFGRSIAFAAICLLLAGYQSTLSAATVEPTVDGTIRDFPADGIPDVVLEGVTVETLASIGGMGAAPIEERGIIEFNLSGVSEPILNATLVLPVWASMGPFPFTVDVFGYAGNGVLELSDWAQGSLLTSITYSGEQSVALDVTAFISSAVANGTAFAGFNLRFAVPSVIPINAPFVAFRSLELPPSASLMVNESSRLVSIDIKPGSDTNPINPGSKGKIPVAILTTENFAATLVNATTVRFGANGTEAAPVMFSVEDVNDDGLPDLMLHFSTQETRIPCGATAAFLTGETLDGQAIQGSDVIETVGCR